MFGKTPAQGAIPVTFLATAADVASHPGAVWDEGPRVKLAKVKPYVTDENSAAAWTAINAAIKATGRAAL
jgi:hypothetical protein